MLYKLTLQIPSEQGDWLKPVTGRYYFQVGFFGVVVMILLNSSCVDLIFIPKTSLTHAIAWEAH